MPCRAARLGLAKVPITPTRKGISGVRLSDTRSARSAVFDDPNLVLSAGLVLVLVLVLALARFCRAVRRLGSRVCRMTVLCHGIFPASDTVVQAGSDHEDVAP